MADTSFHLKVVSAEKHLYDGEVKTYIQVTGSEGELRYLSAACPVINCHKTGHGTCRKTSGEEEEFIYLSGGILEVQPTGVIVLADMAAIRGRDLDEAKARWNLSVKAEEHIQSSHGDV